MKKKTGKPADSDDLRRKSEEEVLQIAKGVSAAVGEKFFCSIIEHLSKILEADYAYIAQTIKGVPSSVRTLALYADGKFIDNIEVNLAGTPCDTVRDKTCSYPSGVQRLFPDAKMMALMNVEGYTGTPLLGSTGEWLGIMAVMFRRPVENEVLVMSLLQIFAARAAAELERKEAEDALRESEQKYRALFEGAPDSILLVDAATGEPVAFNDRAHESLGYTREEFGKLRISDFEVFESAEDVENHIREIIEKGSDTFETKHRTKDGRIRDVLVSSKAVTFGGRDLTQSILTDISERKRAEAATLNYKNQLQAVKDIGVLANSTLNIEVVLQNILDGTIKAAGVSAGMIFIRSSDNTLKWGASKGLSERFVASFNDKHIIPGEGLTGRIFQTGAPIYIESNSSHDPRVVRNIIKDEGLNSFIGVPVFSGDEVIGVLNILTRQPEVLAEDKLTLVSLIGNHVGSAIRNALLFRERQEAENALRKANEEIAEWNLQLGKKMREKAEELVRSQARLFQSEKLAAMGQMAAGLAHELNSPLAGLLPMIEKYRNEAEEGSRAHMELSIMLNACEHMARIVRDFSTFSRESKGEHSALNLNEIIEDTLSFSAGTFKQGNIQLIKRYDDKLPAVMGEKTGLQQVVLNIIKNACDAMPGGGELAIKTFFSEDKKDVIMEFIDNGAGIANEDIDNIFDPFFTTKRPGKGIGLGLSVSYHIIDKHGGNMSVVSGPGRGTKFSIYLPAVKISNIIIEE